MFYGRKDGEGVDWVGIETDEDKPVGYENPFTTEASEKEWKLSKTKNNIKKREREMLKTRKEGIVGCGRWKFLLESI